MINEKDDDLDEFPAPPRRGMLASDRELLELAARALGAVRVEDVEGENWVNLHFEDGSTVFHWNSLVHSDDALDLAVDLRLTVYVFECTVGASKGSINAWPSVSENAEQGHKPATRRAITRAAAEIGKGRQ